MDTDGDEPLEFGDLEMSTPEPGIAPVMPSPARLEDPMHRRNALTPSSPPHARSAKRGHVGCDDPGDTDGDFHAHKKGKH